MSTPTTDPADKPDSQALGKVKQAVARLPAKPSDERAFWRNADGRVFGRFQDQVITSRFLPIQDLETGELIGHAAATEDEAGQPVELDLDNLDSNTFIASDRLLRALHTLNYYGVSPLPVRLYLDVNQRFFTSVVDNHGKAFRLLIESLGLGAGHFVIQVVANELTDLSTLAFAADNYRRNGFLTGLHARTPLEANSLIAQIRPDFLSLWLNAQWPMSSLAELRKAADQFHVELIARHDTPDTSLYAARQAGIHFALRPHSVEPA
ncbi:MAG: hypothetical protein ACK4FF_07720 [Limnobacter sp.]|uniref:hypothetical protein n=1 Tax=Limnobacter sp. TaxID=2003368 RepID=UPI0039190A03